MFLFYFIFLELDFFLIFLVHFDMHVTIFLLISKSCLNYLDIISFMFHSFVELFPFLLHRL
jgi:hypothetical protein